MLNYNDNLFSVLLHEMRSPINTILGLVDLAKKDIDNPDEIIIHLEKISKASNYLLNLSNNYLELTKCKSVQMISDEKEFDIDTLIDYVISMFEVQFAMKSICFNCHRSKFNYHLVGDGLLLKQVLINLLSNAFKFTPNGGTVDFLIETNKKPNKVDLHFMISDTGVGINPRHLKKIFKPFYQEKKKDIKPTGTGLGMSIVKKNVKLLGGKIDVASELGKGTIFNLDFSFGISSKEAIIDNCDFSNRRFLIVDDSDIHHEIIKEVLCETNAKLEFAFDGEEALQMIQSSPEFFYDLIFMDMRLPKLCGCDAVKLIRSLDRKDVKELKIICLSANHLTEDINIALSSGMDDYLIKPFDLKCLLKIINRYIGS